MHSNWRKIELIVPAKHFKPHKPSNESNQQTKYYCEGATIDETGREINILAAFG